jgi:hypothetical protein
VKISPSTLKRAKCERRVVAEKWGGYQDDFGKAAAFGTEVHGVGERWMKGEAEPDPSTKAGRLFLEILPHVPSRDLEAERYLKFTADGIQFHGYIDFGGWCGSELVYGDYKTSSRPWDYGLSNKEDFLADEQVNIYGLAQMLDYGGTSAHAYWLYADTSKSRFAYVQDSILTYPQVEDYMADVALPKARSVISHFDAAIAAAGEKPTDHEVKLQVINSIPCNPTECDYRMRNCGFRKHCDLLSEPTLVMMEQDMSESDTDVAAMLAKIEAKKKARAAAAAQAEGTDEKVVAASTPAEPRVLPPEAAEVLPVAVAERELPPEEQTLGRKAKEAQAKAEEKAAKAEAKKGKVSKVEPAGDVKSAVEALKAVVGVDCEVWVKL